MRSVSGILSVLFAVIVVAAVVGGIVALIVFLSSKSKQKEEDNTVTEGDKSYFDGGYLAYIGYSFLVVFVTAITLGIAFPWMFCLLQRWKAKHTIVCGKRMYFDGTGIQLIGNYILWMFLSFITFGIYSLWMTIAIRKWVSKHTHFVGEEDNNSYFDGGVLGLIGTSILSILVLFVPLVGPAWSNIIKLRWERKHTVTDSRRLVFTGTIGNFFLKYLLWGFLTGITFGIFGIFVPVKNLRLEAENTIDHEHTTQALIKQSEYRNIIRTDTSTFKSLNVEYEMEAIKAGITDSISKEELFALANCGCRSAQYLYVVRFADEQYTEEPFSSLLKASAEAEYAPAMCLYALTHNVEATREMLDKSAEKGQVPAIRNRLIFNGNFGLSTENTKLSLEYLKKAVRYGDLLLESGIELTEEELAVIKKCVMAIRKSESSAVVSKGNGGKIAAIVIAVILAVSILFGAISTLLFKRVSFDSRNDVDYNTQMGDMLY